MDDPGLSWYAIYTKPRHEKTVAESLWMKGIECFLPLRPVVSKWSDRQKLVRFPLFPGYLFVHVDLPSRKLAIVQVESVVRIVGFGGAPEPIPDSQIQAVKTLVFHDMELDPHPYLKSGDRVRIIRGPLRGLEGMLIEKKNRYTFVLSVDLIRQSVACHIDAADVERLG